MTRYAERDHLALGQTYCDHVEAMTAEGLHAKSAIAAELAWRDLQISERDAELARLRAEVAERDSIVSEICDVFGIGAEARSREAILANVMNAARFARLLSAVEREFLMVPGESDDDYPNDEPEPECLVNSWGSTEAEYIEQFRTALATLAARNSKEAGHG